MLWRRWYLVYSVARGRGRGQSRSKGGTVRAEDLNHQMAKGAKGVVFRTTQGRGSINQQIQGLCAYQYFNLWQLWKGSLNSGAPVTVPCFWTNYQARAIHFLNFTGEDWESLCVMMAGADVHSPWDRAKPKFWERMSLRTDKITGVRRWWHYGRIFFSLWPQWGSFQLGDWR